MSSRQSFLSSPRFGYNIAVGVTQASVNATMKQYLDRLPIPEFVICFVADEEGAPKQIDYEQLKKNAKGADPFSIPNKADPKTNPDILKLKEARFITGFKAKIGLPPGMAPGKIPDIVTLDNDNTFVTFRLMCAAFTAVQLVMDGYGPPKWVNISQNPQSPIQFTSKVDLRQIIANSDNLPPAVKKRREEFTRSGFGFSIQQLFLDLDTAFGATTPEIAGVEDGSWLQSCLNRYFVSVYMKTLKANPAPVLGYSFQYTKPEGLILATLPITNTAMVVSPYVDANGNRVQNPTPVQREVATLNYQCMIYYKQAPPSVPFNWNWVETNEMGDFDGVMAINRNTFAYYMYQMLNYIVPKNCYKSTVRVWLSGIFKTTVNFSWGLAGNQQPSVSFPESGPMVLSYSYSSQAYDGAGAGDWMGRMSLAPDYNVTVSFQNNTIIIKQRLAIYLRIGVLANNASGNVIDRTITDTYTLTIENNRLVAKQTTTTADNPTMGDVGAFFDFFTGIRALVENVKDWLNKVTQTQLNSMPLSVVQDFIFPGGNAFAFKKAMFSDRQDLLAHITYLAPETTRFLATPRNP